MFRYPGGKGRQLPALRPYLDNIMKDSDEFHDVFTGGGSVAIDVAEYYPEAHIFMNDLDRHISAFWRLVSIGEESDEFIELLRQTPTVQMFRHMRTTSPYTLVPTAYHAVFFNRTAFSGIFTSGPIGGYEQKSKWTIDCRYNAEGLIKEYRRLIALFKDRLTVTELDGFEYATHCEGPMYLDPPYFRQGDSLYPTKFVFHKQLAEALANKGKWVLSYDMDEGVKQIYADDEVFRMEPLRIRHSIRGKKKKWREWSELVITPNLETSQNLTLW